MRSLFARLYEIEQCPTKSCRIVEKENYRDVRFCAECTAKEKDMEKSKEAMSMDDYIREIVNGRADVGDCAKKSQALYERYMSEMPYDTQKARDGDPYEWIAERLERSYAHLIEDEATA